MTPVTTLVDLAANPSLPGWARIMLWCWGHADQHGHARAYTGQLRAELGFSSARDVSRAVRQARARRALDPCSTAACLVIPGRAIAPCEANHRGIP